MRRRSAIPLVVALAFVAFVFYSLGQVEPVKVTESRIERRGRLVFVEGALKNAGPEVGAVAVEIRYYNDRGGALGQETLTLGPLPRGGVTHFRSDGRELPDVSSFSIRVDRGRNPYGN